MRRPATDQDERALCRLLAEDALLAASAARRSARWRLVAAPLRRAAGGELPGLLALALLLVAPAAALWLLAGLSLGVGLALGTGGLAAAWAAFAWAFGGRAEPGEAADRVLHDRLFDLNARFDRLAAWGLLAEPLPTRPLPQLERALRTLIERLHAGAEGGSGEPLRRRPRRDVRLPGRRRSVPALRQRARRAVRRAAGGGRVRRRRPVHLRRRLPRRRVCRAPLRPLGRRLSGLPRPRAAGVRRRTGGHGRRPGRVLPDGSGPRPGLLGGAAAPRARARRLQDWYDPRRYWTGRREDPRDSCRATGPVGDPLPPRNRLCAYRSVWGCAAPDLACTRAADCAAVACRPDHPSAACRARPACATRYCAADRGCSFPPDGACVPLGEP